MQLSELLAVTGLNLVASGEQADPTVTWVHTTELLDASRYLSGGEVLLTTGLWRRQRGTADRFVRVLRSAGVSALGYGLPAPDTSIPNDVVAACSDQGLSLIEVPFATPFIAISKAFVEWTTASREQWLLRSLERGESMARSVRDGGGPDGLLEILHRDAGLSSAVITHAGELLGRAGPYATAEAVAAFVDALRADGRGGPVPKIPGQIVFEIAATHLRDGFLTCFSDEGLSDDVRATVEQAIAYLGVEIARGQAIRATELRFVGEILELADAGASRLVDLIDRMSALGIEPEADLGVIVAAATYEGAREPELAALDQTLRLHNVPGVVLTRGNDHVLILQAPSVDALRSSADVAIRQLQRHPSVSAAAVGIGLTTDGVVGLRKALNQAREACVVARDRADAFSVGMPEDAASHSLLLALADSESREALLTALIEPLRAHDAERQSDLVLTLDTFLTRAGQYQRTAEELHIHVNTLRHRLGRIEEITRRDLGDMATRVDFYLALRIARSTPATGRR